jgi:hypothetical protein
MSLQSEITLAVSKNYPEVLRLSDGYIVISESRLICRVDLGAQRLFGIEEQQALNDTLKIFLPESMQGAIHDRLINGEFAKLRASIESTSPYEGRLMSARADGQPRWIEAYTFQREQISIGIEFEPLVINKELFMIAFITRDPSHATEQRAIASTVESKAVVKSAQVEMGLQILDSGGKRFTGGYYWLKSEVFNGWPLAGFWSFSVMGAFSGGLLTIILLATGVIKLPKSTIQQFNFPSDQSTNFAPDSDGIK